MQPSRLYEDISRSSGRSRAIFEVDGRIKVKSAQPSGMHCILRNAVPR